jgi:peptide/nickel transport system permease protein
MSSPAAIRTPPARNRIRQHLWWSTGPRGLPAAVPLVCGAYLSFVIAVILVGPFFVSDPSAQDLLHRLRPPTLGSDPTAHPFGTDQLGRDVLSRVVVGTRISVLVAGAGVLVSCVIGTLVGLVAGYYRGPVDEVAMRVVDAQLAVPFLLLAMTVVGILGTNVVVVVVAMLLATWVLFARLVRAEVLALRERDFVTAARSLGASDLRILAIHILPNLFTPLMVLVTLEVSDLILLEAALDFLGLGVGPPTSSWGQLISDGRAYMIAGAWWLTVFPGAAIVLTVLCVNALGDWMRSRFGAHVEP